MTSQKKREINAKKSSFLKSNSGRSELESKLKLNWTEFLSKTQALDLLSDKVICHASTKWNYYACRIGRFRFWSKLFTLLIIMGLLSGISIEIAQLSISNSALQDQNKIIIQALEAESLSDKQEVIDMIQTIPDFTSIGLIILSIAFGLLLIDRNIGITSTYIRYVKANMQLHHLITDFTDTWQIKTCGIFQKDKNGKIVYPSSPTDDIPDVQFEFLSKIITDFKDQIDEIVHLETEEWENQMKTSRVELEKMVTKKYQDLKKEVHDRQERLKKELDENRKIYNETIQNRFIELQFSGLERFDKSELDVLFNGVKVSSTISLHSGYKSLIIPNLSNNIYFVQVSSWDKNGKEHFHSLSANLKNNEFVNLKIDFSSTET